MMLLLCLLVPAGAALLIAACRRRPNLREAATITAAATLFLLVASLWDPVLQGSHPSLVLGEILPGLEIKLELEPLGLLFALVASGLWLVSGVYSIGYLRGNDEAHQTRFYACFALAICAALGVALAGNLLTLYLLY